MLAAKQKHYPSSSGSLSSSSYLTSSKPSLWLTSYKRENRNTNLLGPGHSMMASLNFAILQIVCHVRDVTILSTVIKSSQKANKND